MIRKLLFSVAMLACGAFGASAQTLLFGADASFKLPAQLSVGAGVEFRSMDWFSHADRWSADVSLGWKPRKWLKVAADYEFMQTQTLSSFNSDGYSMPSYWNAKHRVSAGATATWKASKKFSFSLRERYQYTDRPEFRVPQFNDDIPWGNKTISGKGKHVLRSRIAAEYKPYKKCRFTPFVNFELYSQLRDVNRTKNKTAGARFCDKWRITAGTEFKINKRNGLEMFYRYTNHSDADDGDMSHTVALVYSFSL